MKLKPIDQTTVFNSVYADEDTACEGIIGILRAHKEHQVTINGSYGENKFLMQKNALNSILITQESQLKTVCQLWQKLNRQSGLLIMFSQEKDEKHQELVKECLSQNPNL